MNFSKLSLFITTSFSTITPVVSVISCVSNDNLFDKYLRELRNLLINNVNDLVDIKIEKQEDPDLITINDVFNKPISYINVELSETAIEWNKKINSNTELSNDEKGFLQIQKKDWKIFIPTLLSQDNDLIKEITILATLDKGPFDDINAVIAKKSIEIEKIIVNEKNRKFVSHELKYDKDRNFNNDLENLIRERAKKYTKENVEENPSVLNFNIYNEWDQKLVTDAVQKNAYVFFDKNNSISFPESPYNFYVYFSDSSLNSLDEIEAKCLYYKLVIEYQLQFKESEGN